MDNKIIYVDNAKEGQDSNCTKLNLRGLINTKSVKIIALLAIFLALVIVISGVKSSDNTATSTSNTTTTYTTTLDYCAELEKKLEQVLSQVKGVGSVRVMVSVDGSPELIYAKDEDEKVSSNAGGTTTSSNSSSPIIVTVNGNSNALILTENLPNVKGVIVVASGAEDISVKFDILNAVSKLLDISIDKVSVLNGI